MAKAPAYSQKNISKGTLQEKFGFSDPEYVDLTRNRPKKPKPYNYPFFRPLCVPKERLGRGKGGFLTYTFPDFLLLEILILLKAHNLPREMGYWIRNLSIGMETFPEQQKYEHIFSPYFDYRIKWRLEIEMDSLGQALLGYVYGDMKLSGQGHHSVAIQRDKKGLKGLPNDHYETEDTVLKLSIDLNKIHKKVIGLYLMV